MIELPLIILCLCAIIVTWSVMITAFDLRLTLRRVNALLPEAEQTLKEAKHSLTRLRRVMARTDVVSKQVEAIAMKACGAVSGVVEQVVAFKDQAEHSLGRWLGTNGHGTGNGSRSHRRNSNK